MNNANAFMLRAVIYNAKHQKLAIGEEKLGFEREKLAIGEEKPGFGEENGFADR